MVDKGDQTHAVRYVPSREGPYSISVLYGDQAVPHRSASGTFSPSLRSVTLAYVQADKVANVSCLLQFTTAWSLAK